MLSMPFAEDEAAKVATKRRAAVDATDDDDGDASGAGSAGAAYSFEGYQIESSERIILTPMGVPAARTPRPRS